MSLALRVDLMFCDDKRLERRMAYFFQMELGGMAIFTVDPLKE